MNYIEELNSIWNSNVPRDLEEVIDQCLELILKAKKHKEIVPLDLENDIILTANYSRGFGSQKNEAIQIMNLLYRNLESVEKHSKIYRLTATAASVLLTALTTDEQNNERSVVEILQKFGSEPSNTRVKIIRLFLDQILSVLNGTRPNYWVLETISFALTFLLILQDIGGIEINHSLDKIKTILKDPLSEKEREDIEYWQKSWTEKNDYFRFITLMIFNIHPQEDSWKNLANQLLS